MTRGWWLHSGGRSTSVAAAATSTLIGLTSYHLGERNVMNSRFVGSTAKISREFAPLPPPTIFSPFFFFFSFTRSLSNSSVAHFFLSFFAPIPRPINVNQIDLFVRIRPFSLPIENEN